MAQNIFDLLIAKIRLGQWHPETIQKEKQEYTFKEFAERYMQWAEGRQRAFRRWKRYIIAQLIDSFGHLLLSDFTTQMLEQYQTDRLNKGNKPATVNRLIAVLAHMINKASDWEMCNPDIIRRIRKVKYLKENNRRLRYLTKEECQSLINACEPHLKPIVITALHTGMRKGEILKLKWDNVDLRHGFISLNPTQTKNAERKEIPINTTLRAVFQTITRRLDIPYVFFDPATGKPYQDVKRSFNTACRRAGIRDFHFHDLRHTFASHLVMTGVDLTTVKELLGHKTLTMTLRYAHLAPSHKVEAMEKLSNFFSQKTAQNEGQKQGKYYDFMTPTEHSLTANAKIS